jgi:hypothetical protein
MEIKAQDVADDFLSGVLSDGDILFIDSTHTVKHDSDCIHIYLRMLPNIESDIHVHVHDIHLPSPLPIEYMRDKQVYWTEQYLLYAYLLNNYRTEVVYGSAYHYERNREQLKAFMHGRWQEGGASLWFRQKRL